MSDLSKNERLKKFVDYLKYKDIVGGDGEFADFLEKKRSFISEILSGKRPVTDAFAKYVGENYSLLNVEWLISGNGEMLNTSGQLSKSQTSPINEKNLTPLYDFNAMTGIMSGAKPAPLDYIYIPNVSSCDGATVVRGNSMAPRLQAGDIVLFKVVKDKKGIYWGEMYLVLFNLAGIDYVVLQYLKKSESESFVRLSGYDSTSSPQEIPFDSIKALAMVKAGVIYTTMM